MALWLILLVMLLQPAAPTPRYERLDNGLRVVVVEDHALPLVSVQLWYAVGSACDPPGRSGLCNVARAVVAGNGQANARQPFGAPRVSRTERDACWFQLLLPPCYLEDALDASAKRMAPAKVSEDDARTCLDSAVLAARGLDGPDAVVTRHALAALYPNHPYGRPPTFIAESLAADEVNAFLQRWFVPSNATLLVYGDISTPRVLDMVRRRFAGLEWAQPPRRPEQSPSETEQRRVVRVFDEQAGVTVAWETPPMGYFENAAIDVLMHRLCNPVDGPLRAQLIELGCDPPRWSRSAWRDSGVLVLHAEAARDPSTNLDNIAGVVDAALKRLIERTYSEIAHNRARARARRDAMLKEADFAERARRLARAEVVAGDLMLARFQARRVAAVSIMDVQAVARMLLESRRVVVRRLDREEVEKLDPDDASTTLDQPHRGSSRQPTRSEEEAATPEEQRARKAQARLVPTPANRPTITSARITDDVTLTVCRVPAGGMVEVRTLVKTESRASARAAVPARDSSENNENAQTNLAKPADSHGNSPTKRASTPRSAEQWLDYLTYHGLDLAHLDRPVRYGLTSRGPAEFTPQMVELQAELLFSSSRGPEGAKVGAATPQEQFVRVLIVGDIAVEAARNAVAAAWSDRWITVEAPAIEAAWLTALPQSPIVKSWLGLSSAGRLTALRDNRVIADLLEHGIADPWDMEDAVREGEAPAEPGGVDVSP